MPFLETTANITLVIILEAIPKAQITGEDCFTDVVPPEVEAAVRSNRWF